MLAAFADRPLLLQLQASCRVAANSGSVPTGDILGNLEDRVRGQAFAALFYCLV
jgi:hypothetical protein